MNPRYRLVTGRRELKDPRSVGDQWARSECAMLYSKRQARAVLVQHMWRLE